MTLRAGVFGAVMFCALSGQGMAAPKTVPSPAERQKLIDEVRAKYGAPAAVREDDSAAQVTLEGNIRTEDGGPVPDKNVVHVISRQGQFAESRDRFEDVKSPFALKVQPGSCWLLVSAPGYAFGEFGPYRGTPGATVKDVAVVLRRGVNVRLEIVDEANQPVAFPQVQGQSSEGFACGWEGGEDGVVVIEHASEQPYWLAATARGFQPNWRKWQFKEGEKPRWTLQRARPTTGHIVAADGKPVAHAELKMWGTLKDGRVDTFSAWKGMKLGETDGQGQFALDQLVSGYEYHILVDAGAGGQFIIEGVRDGQSGLEFKLKPELYVRGRIVGDLAKLEQNESRPVIYYMTKVTLKGSSYGGVPKIVPIEVKDGVGRFEIRGLVPGEYEFIVGKRITKVALSEPQESLLLETESDQKSVGGDKRRVIVKIKVPAGDPPPAGKIQVSSNLETRRYGSDENVFEIKDGQVAFDAYVGAEVRCEAIGMGAYLLKLDGDRAIRYGGGSQIEIPQVAAGSEPLVVSASLIPVGVIGGKMLLPDGQPAGDGVTVMWATLSWSKEAGGWSGSSHGLFVDPTNGTFVTDAARLGGSYAFEASRGKNIVFSDIIKLDAARPVTTVELRFSKGVDTKLELAGPDGRPIAGVEASVFVDGPNGRSFSSFYELKTDEAGQIMLADLNPDPRLKYALSVDMRKDYQPIRRKGFKPDGKLIKLRLQRGEGLEGQVIDAETQKPVAGAEVRASGPGGWFLDQDEEFDAEGKTDEKGHFRFSNLALGKYHVRVVDIGGKWPQKNGEVEVSAGRKKPVTLEVDVPVQDPGKTDE